LPFPGVELVTERLSQHPVLEPALANDSDVTDHQKRQAERIAREHGESCVQDQITEVHGMAYEPEKATTGHEMSWW
jgi:hypothetical protein